MLTFSPIDQGRNEEVRRVRFQQPGRGVQNFSSHNQWHNGGYSYPVSAGDNESESEVATISAAIMAREISDQENQKLVAESIYPESSLPSYNQGNYSEMVILFITLYNINILMFSQ